MRNDARPIGEEFRDIAEHEGQEGPVEHPPAEQARVLPEPKPYVVRRDPADPPPDASER